MLETFDTADRTFLSTLSLRRATCLCGGRVTRPSFLSTLSLRRATRHLIAQRIDHSNISIHALLAESDVGLLTHNGHPQYISIHALLAESDRHNRQGLGQIVQFLSTLSLRRATTQPRPRCKAGSYFYPRSPCGERLLLGVNC